MLNNFLAQIQLANIDRSPGDNFTTETFNLGHTL